MLSTSLSSELLVGRLRRLGKVSCAAAQGSGCDVCKLLAGMLSAGLGQPKVSLKHLALNAA